MKEIGIILENRGKDAIVSIQRHAACGDCGACHIGKNKETVETTARNPIGAQKGETVEVEMEFVSVFRAAFIAYGVPLIFFLVGSVAAYLLIEQLGLDFDLVLVPFFTGLIFLVIAYLGIRVFDNKGYFRSRYMPVITGITEPVENNCSPAEKIMGNR